MKNRPDKEAVPLYAAKDLKRGKNAKPVGTMRNPDLPGCVVDRKTFEKLYGVKFPKCGLSGLNPTFQEKRENSSVAGVFSLFGQLAFRFSTTS